MKNLLEETKIAALSCTESYIHSVIDSIEFSCGKLSEQEKEEITSSLFEHMKKNIKFIVIKGI